MLADVSAVPENISLIPEKKIIVNHIDMFIIIVPLEVDQVACWFVILNFSLSYLKKTIFDNQKTHNIILPQISHRDLLLHPAWD